jgi:predicted phage tail protein
MLKKVKLYGELAEKYGKDWYLDVNSPSEAVRALMANNPGFKQFVSASEDRGMGYTVKVGESYVQDIPEIHNPSGRQEIKIIPVVLGAKKDGMMAIIIGVALIAASGGIGALGGAAAGGGTVAAEGAMSSGLAGLNTMGAASTSGIASAISGAMAHVGASMIYGGIAQLLATTPEEVKDDPNYAFNGAKNTVKQGGAVPICYGQLMIGGAVISSGITSENYNP